MRLFQVCNDPGIPPGGTKGASVHLRRLAAALRDEGHEVETFVARSDGNEDFPVPLIGNATTQALLRRADEAGPPDVVYERYALGSASGLDAARCLDRPFVLEVNAPLAEETRRYRPARSGHGDEQKERMLVQAADLVVVVSEPLQGWVTALRGSPERTLVNPNGCDPELFPRPARTSRGGPATVAFLGHPKPWHGAVQLPELLAALVGRGWDVRLLVIGGGPGAEDVVARALSLGVSDRVDVTGAVAPTVAARRLSEATLLVAPYPRLPSFYFCPIKLVEAMAAGLPVVTTAQGDLPRLIEGAGRVVPPDDSGALLEVVEELLADEHLRRTLGRCGRARARRDLSWRANARRLVSAISSLRTESTP